MSRGGLLLRHAAGGVELDYSVLEPDVKRRGPRPPRLIVLACGSRPSPRIRAIQLPEPRAFD